MMFLFMLILTIASFSCGLWPLGLIFGTLTYGLMEAR